MTVEPVGPANQLHSQSAPPNVCPESVVQVVGRHPDTVNNDGRNNSLSNTLTCDQQHYIGAEQDPAPVDQGFYQGSCSSFQLLDVFQMRCQSLGELVCVATLSLSQSLKPVSNFVKAFVACYLSHAWVHIGVLVCLACDSTF